MNVDLVRKGKVLTENELCYALLLIRLTSRKLYELLMVIKPRGTMVMVISSSRIHGQLWVMTFVLQ